MGIEWWPLTDNEHKTLLKINNITIIDNIIDSLVTNSINEVVIVTGYRADELKNYLLDNINIISNLYIIKILEQLIIFFFITCF